MPSVCLVDATCCAPVCELVNPMFSVFVTVGAFVAALGAADGVAVVPPHAAPSSPAAVASAVKCRMALIGTLLFPQACRSGRPLPPAIVPRSTVDTPHRAWGVRPRALRPNDAWYKGGRDGDDASGESDLERRSAQGLGVGERDLEP